MCDYTTMVCAIEQTTSSMTVQCFNFWTKGRHMYISHPLLTNVRLDWLAEENNQLNEIERSLFLYIMSL